MIYSPAERTEWSEIARRRRPERQHRRAWQTATRSVPGGCDRCKQTGYSGRTGIHELLILTPQHQTAMLDGMNMNRLKEISRADGFRTLFEDGLLKAIQGVTSVEEILRVTNR